MKTAGKGGTLSRAEPALSLPMGQQADTKCCFAAPRLGGRSITVAALMGFHTDSKVRTGEKTTKEIYKSRIFP